MNWVKVILIMMTAFSLPLAAMVVAIVLGSREEDGADENGAEAHALEMLDDAEGQALWEEEDEKDKKE